MSVGGPENRVNNPRFDDDLAQWTPGALAQIVTDPVVSPTKACRIRSTYTDPPGIDVRGDLRQSITPGRLISGRTYGVSFWASSVDAGTGPPGSYVVLVCSFDPGDGIFANVAVLDPNDSTTTAYVQYTFDLPALVDPNLCVLRFRNNTITNPASIDAKDWFIDDIEIFDNTQPDPALPGGDVSTVDNSPGSVFLGQKPDVQLKPSQYDDVYGTLHRQVEMTRDRNGRVVRASDEDDLDHDEHISTWHPRTEEELPDP